MFYGADAVYIGGEAFGLRAKAHNFSNEEMKQGIAFAHARGVKVYVTANILAHNGDLPGWRAYFEEMRDVAPDALIISDPVCSPLPEEFFLTWKPYKHPGQQHQLRDLSVLAWTGGQRRVVSARELSLAEIREIRDHIPPGYADRELYPRRHVHILFRQMPSEQLFLWEGMPTRAPAPIPAAGNIPLVEETRPGEYMPVYENERGTYIFNSKDLCMVEYIPEMMDAGIDSFKIEGRMKTALLCGHCHQGPTAGQLMII